MKLIFCNNCQSVFSLKLNVLKACDCGDCSGQYIDKLNAEFSGPATLLGFANSEFRQALSFKGLNFKGFTIKEPCQTFKRIQNL